MTADDPAIRAALREKRGWSAQNVSNRVKRVRDEHLMSRSHALYVLAHREGLDLERFGLDHASLVEVEQLSRATSETATSSPTPRPSPSRTGGPNDRARSAAAATPAKTFAGRSLHPNIVRSSRKAYTSGLRQEAVRKAFQSVNNRVKKITSTTQDGFGLMGWAFGSTPQLQMTALTTESEQNEQDGLRFLMQGAMKGIRNPRAHDDHWAADDDDEAVLELLGFASYLHRCLDRCEQYQAANP